MTTRAATRPVRLLASLLAAGAAGTALTACGEDAPPPAALSKAQVSEQLAKPAAGDAAGQRELERRAGTLLAPGAGRDVGDVLSKELRALRGTPVIVNVWAQWCAPCKREIPLFQRLALERRGELAVLGIASDRRAKAQELLDQIAMPYPSVLDEDGELSGSVGVNSIPKTFFYDAQGKREFVKLGEYKTLKSLEEDAARYLGVATSK